MVSICYVSPLQGSEEGYYHAGKLGMSRLQNEVECKVYSVAKCEEGVGDEWLSI